MQDLAHITEINGQRVEQSVASHSLNVAAYAAQKLKGMNLRHTAYLAGLLHDMGKCTDQYQDYLRRAANHEDVKRGSVNHTFCGCIYLLKKYHSGRPQGMDTMACELLVYAMGSHHGQFDCVSLENTSGFEKRLYKDAAEIEYPQAVERFLVQCVSSEEIDRLFLLAQNEITSLFQSLKIQFGKGATQIHFLMGLAARMVLSAVIDGDRRDTAEFMSGTKHSFRAGSPNLWEEQIQFLEQKLSAFDATAPINRVRRCFSELCRDFACQHGGGIYRLTLPTGAGKTLSALRYALHHAKTYEKKRVIFVIPLLSILEQNSGVIRSFLQDQSILTEHHSNVVKTFETPEELDHYELLTETWESPIVITTLVQLLNTLFSGKTTAVRRMSALTDAVIVIDEIQSLPKRVTNMFNMALNFLAGACGATVVLSSATQPCFDETARPLRYSQPVDIVPYDPAIFDTLKRTRIVDYTSPYGMSLEELADFSQSLLQEGSSLLIVCNTKESARKLYDELDSRSASKLFHLSVSMCPAHRADTLAHIHTALDGREKAICVSTQLVEAGVDFSFESVIRVEAGLDNIAQAAGRCNRSFDFGGIRSVYIVKLRQDAEKLGMLPEIAAAQQCTEQLLHQFADNPQSLDADLLSEKSIAQYYNLLFGHSAIKGQFGFPRILSHDQREQLFDLLADNPNHIKRPEFKGRYFFNQAFKTAGELFEVFDENTTDIIVPYNEQADQVIADLFSQKAAHDYGFLKECIERAKPYTIHIFKHQYMKLMEYGMLLSDKQNRFLALNKQYYHAETGLIMEKFIY